MLKERNVRTGFFEREQTERTKNDEGRSFPFTDALGRLLEAQKAEHELLLNTLQPVPPASNRDGHNPGTVEPDRDSRLRASL